MTSALDTIDQLHFLPMSNLEMSVISVFFYVNKRNTWLLVVVKGSVIVMN